MVLTYPHDYKSTTSKCVIRVDGQSFDCSTWRHCHPGGAQLIDRFHNADATDAFYAFHSPEAIAKLKKMRSVPAADEQRDIISIAFEKFRKDLERDGWFERIWFIDIARNVFPVILFVCLGAYLSTSNPVIATLLIGLGMQQAGWIAHDYSHGHGELSLFLGQTLGGLINGFSNSWWNCKHNTHHTFPNRKGFDSDIHNEPILHLWFPSKDADVWYRKFQHLYYLPAYSFLYYSWRLQSVQFVLGSKDWYERALIATHYILLACLPWKVAICSIFVGGFLVAFVVTANHQTEEMLEGDEKYNYVVDQFRTTRGIACPDPVTEYLFGGMQYQLEHHLFPFMPRYYYPKLRPLVTKFAEENSMQHHISGMTEIIKMNYDVVKKYSE